MRYFATFNDKSYRIFLFLAVKVNPRCAMFFTLKSYSINFKVRKFASICDLKIIKNVINFKLQWTPKLTSLVIVHYWLVDLFLFTTSKMRNIFLDESNHQVVIININCNDHS